MIPPEAADFLRQAGWGDARVERLAGDASARRYLRLREGRRRAVLMCAPADAALEAFLRLTPWLRDGGIAAPAILATRPGAGLVLLEDLGARSLAAQAAARPDRALALYAAAARALAVFQALPPPPGLTVQAPALLAAQIAPLEDYAPDAPLAEIAGALQAALEAAGIGADGTDVPVHRDFHAENLLWRPGRRGIARIGVIDYQDAMLGDPAYDMASLLRDARRDVPAGVARAAIAAHGAAIATAAGRVRPHRLHLLALARNLRILGLFARLARRGGKPGYLVYMPRVWRMLAEDAEAACLPALSALVPRALPAPTPERLAWLRAAPLGAVAA